MEENERRIKTSSLNVSKRLYKIRTDPNPQITEEIYHSNSDNEIFDIKNICAKKLKT